MSAVLPSGSAMKPKPFLLLNHLMVPLGMVLWGLTLGRDDTRNAVYA